MSANVIDSHLANIINNDITKNVFSEKAKVASVRPIFKKIEREKIENYRLLSILNCFRRFVKSFFLKSLSHLKIHFYQNIWQRTEKNIALTTF